jgi:hypothetical protein
MREAKETASDMVAVLSTYGREAAQGWLVVVLFAYAGRLLRDAEDSEAGRLMLPNLERGINSIECLAVEDTVQAPHNDKIRSLRISIRFFIVDASLQSPRPDTVAGREDVHMRDAQLPLPLRHQLCHATLRRPPRQPVAVNCRRRSLYHL